MLLLTQTSLAQEPKTQTSDSIVVVEQMPQFPGGDEAMMRFVMSNVTYPEYAAANCIQGKVVVRFLVTKDGSVEDVKVVRSVYPSLDAQALRVIKKMPKWTPGMNKGKSVAVYYSVPINFRIRECDDIPKEDVAPQTEGLIPKQLEAIDDSNHPDKEALLGLWGYDSDEITYSYVFKDKEQEAIYKERIEESLEQTMSVIKETLKGATVEFKAENILLSTVKDRETGASVSATGFYKLQDDSLFVHSIEKQADQIFTFKLEGEKLYLNAVVASGFMDGYFIITLEKIK